MADLLTSYAALQPDKVAVIDDRPGMPIQTLTYAELEARANRLANVLLEQGSGRAPRVSGAVRTRSAWWCS